MLQNLKGIPPHMVPHLKDYVWDGIAPGGFLTAVLENDLVRAFNRADGENARAMESWARVLYMEIPTASWGSPEKAAKWCEQGGYNGYLAKPYGNRVP